MVPLQRRQLLALLAAFGAAPAWAARAEQTSLLAAWQLNGEQRIGLLSASERQWSVQRSLAVPTRAHGLWAQAGGSVLAVARRPGDWMLRWHPSTGQTQWHWIEGDRRFNGHVIASTDGATLWTTETDLESAQGRLGVRHAASLEKTGEWSTHGMDPHQLLALPQALGDFPAGTLMVANGGVPTLPETGRSKRALDRMDASLVALHPQTGALLGQWRLADPHLSIRHLAWDPVSQTLGIALQAQHPDPTVAAAAPVLAVWDGHAPHCSALGQPPLAGYGGDICALPGGGFAVSCPRAHALALFGPQAQWLRAIPHTEACALASDNTGSGNRVRQWWLASGRGDVGLLHGGTPPSASVPVQAADAGLRALKIDNHWIALPAG